MLFFSTGVVSYIILINPPYVSRLKILQQYRFSVDYLAVVLFSLYLQIRCYGGYLYSLIMDVFCFAFYKLLALLLIGSIRRENHN